MRARAPGKLVLSGAYSVLEGAPAVVSAVDRYVYCDSERPAERVTPEVRQGLGELAAPHFDSSELRSGGRKLGLGSSAAILVASLACVTAPSALESVPDHALRRNVFDKALRAHRAAQGGGSGIDVAASTWGGTLIAQRDGESLTLEAVELPDGLVVEAWSSGQEASTPDLIARVSRLRSREPERYSELMAPLMAAAHRAAEALRQGNAGAWLRELGAQREGLALLGAAAAAPIITPAVLRLAAAAASPETAVLPSGAGGGDMVLWLGLAPSPEGFRAEARELGHDLVSLSLHATGVQHLLGEVQIGS